MDIATEEAIAALITGDATPGQQVLVWRELSKVKGKLFAREHEVRKFTDAYFNMRDFARSNGLDTATVKSNPTQAGK